MDCPVCTHPRATVAHPSVRVCGILPYTEILGEEEQEIADCEVHVHGGEEVRVVLPRCDIRT